MKLRIVRLSLGLLVAGAPLQATTVVGTGTPASCTEAALDAAIGEANTTFGIVTFDCGPAPHTLILTSEKGLADGVTVDGGGKVSLSGGDTTRLFSLSAGATVAIRDITLTRGSASFGGCLLTQSPAASPAHLSLTRVRFDSCQANLFGGAIAATNADLQLAGGTFSHNRAVNGGGGAISLNGGSISAQGGEFIANTAFDQGGAMQVWFSEVQIAGSRFSGNRSQSATARSAGGGALLLRTSAGTVNDTDFLSNQALRQGGAVFLQDGSDVEFDDGLFQLNDSATGAALFADDVSRATVRRSTFQENGADSGGAIAGGGELHLSSSTFSENFSLFLGPALYVSGAVTLVSSTFFDNFSWSDNTSGQLAWVAPGSMTVHNTLFRAAGQAACSGPGGAFSYSLWNGGTCPAASGPGNVPASFSTLQPLRTSCGGAATELTATHALMPGSGAIDRGSCRPGDPETDQRGMPRPQGAACDIGATEFFEPCDAPLFSDGFENGNTQRWSATLP